MLNIDHEYDENKEIKDFLSKAILFNRWDLLYNKQINNLDDF